MNAHRLLVLVWILFVLSGCGDPIQKQVNAKWPPISADAQRQAAVESTANALGKLNTPNIGIGVKLADAKTVLFTDDLKRQGVTEIDLTGDKQLLHLRVKFSRQFTESDAGDNADLRKLLAALRPEVGGSIDIYAGITGALSAPGTIPELELRLLPALSAVALDKLKLAEKVDAEKAIGPLVDLLNKYRYNISGELTRASFTRVSIPALAPKPIDVSNSFKVIGTDGTASINITGNPVVVPFKLDGIAWLVTDKELTALVQLVPTSPGNPPVTSDALEPTYDAVKGRIEGLTQASFEVPDANSSNWVAIRKDLLAAALNSAVSQAGLCVSAVAETANQRTSDKIPMPSGEGISCSSSRDCSSARQCSFNMVADTRSCSACLLRRPWDGGCIQRGNDPVCELLKGAENDKRRVLANLAKADCDRLRETERLTCEVEKAGEKALCEVKKVTLNALSRTGNFGNVDTELKMRTNGVQVCLRDFALMPQMDKVQFSLDVQGKAQADINVKFTPLDIVGHLACQFPWSKSETFDASLRESRLGIASSVQFVIEKDKARVDFASEELKVKARLSPSPLEYLLKSPQMAVACPILYATTPIVVVLTPFIKELRGEIDYTLPPQRASLDLALPTQNVGSVAVAPKVLATSNALVVVGTLVARK